MKTKHIVLCGLILLKFVLQYILIDPVYELHRDEFLHLDQAQHLAWGYTSVPPFTSWISWIILQLGNGVFWVKFFPALFGALTLLVVWKTIEELKGGWFALLLGAISIVFSSLIRINMLYQPNSPDILAWTLLFFTILKYINTENSKWLWYAGITFAFGFLNKYNIVFLLIGLLPAILISEHRTIFRNKQFYYAMGLAALLVMPNLIWQYLNGFPVFKHLDELARTQLVNVNRFDFVKEQLLFFMGSLFVILAAFVAFVIYKPFRKYRIFGLSFLFTISLFIYLKAKGYYAIGLYPIFLAFGAVYLEQLLSGKRIKYLRPVILGIPVLMFLPMIQIAFPNRTPQEIRQHPEKYKAFGLLRWEDGKDHDLPQDFADMQGWKELAQKVDLAMASIPEKEHTLVLCDNYGQAGAINYYSANKNISAVSMNADYINWFKLDQEIRNVIRVKEIDDNGKELVVSKPYFDRVERFGEITNEFAREKGTSIYVLRNGKVDINQILRKEIAERKSRK
ncbi:MAG: glycosyltransferase family 39 protein [Prolixibacteraceae bacterium]|nr:glycosyltransferase family 39 protein [Prolixibacteraceae bacterium]